MAHDAKSKGLHSLKAGKKKQHKHKRFGPDFPHTFLTLMPGCPGSKSFSPPPALQENTLVGADIHDFRCEGLSKNLVQNKSALMFWTLHRRACKPKCELANILNLPSLRVPQNEVGKRVLSLLLNSWSLSPKLLSLLSSLLCHVLAVLCFSVAFLLSFCSTVKVITLPISEPDLCIAGAGKLRIQRRFGDPCSTYFQVYENKKLSLSFAKKCDEIGESLPEMALSRKLSDPFGEGIAAKK